MTIEHRRYNKGGSYTVLTECPLCGEPFPTQAKRATHIAREHTIEDLGLKPHPEG